MSLLSQELVKGLLFEEENKKTIGIYAGGFKPPTKGHFEVLEKALKENPEIDEMLVYIGKKDRGTISQKESKQIWDIYSKYLPFKVQYIESTVPPIKSVYNYAKENLGEEVLWILGAREENKDDFIDISQRTKSITKYPNLELRTIITKGGISGTAARNALKTTKEKFETFLPDVLSDEDKDKIWVMLTNPITEQYRDTNFDRVEYYKEYFNNLSPSEMEVKREGDNIVISNVSKNDEIPYSLDIPKFNYERTLSENLWHTLNEISLSKENAVEIDGDLTGGKFIVGNITYEYSIKNIPNPYKDLGLFYNIQFTPKGEMTSTPQLGKENYIKILSTMYKIIVDFTNKEQPEYIGISSLDNNGKNYHKVYSNLTNNKSNNIPGYFRKDVNLEFNTPQGKGRFIVLKKKQNLNEEATYSNHIDYKQHIKDLTQDMIRQGMEIKPLPKVRFIHSDSSNAQDFFGKTAYYDPYNMEIVLYTEGRHPKDIVRSFAHEMIHHKQNLEGRLGNINTTNTNEDDELEDIEKEAYLDGNITFRNWTDSLNESKQVGIIYHYTTFENGLKILQSNELKAGHAADSTNANSVYAVSFTRDKRFHNNHNVGFDVSSSGQTPQVRFTVNGDKLSNKFKVQPYSQGGAFSKDKKGFEAEERVTSNKPFSIPIIPYITSVDILIEYKKPSNKYDWIDEINYEEYAPLRAKIIKFTQDRRIPINLIVNKNGDPWPDKAKKTILQKMLNWFSINEEKNKDPFGLNAYAMELGRLREDEDMKVSPFSKDMEEYILSDIKEYGDILEFKIDLEDIYQYSSDSNLWEFYDDVNGVKIIAKLKSTNKNIQEFKFYSLQDGKQLSFGKLKHYNPKVMNTIFKIFMDEVLPNNSKILIQPFDYLRYRLFRAMLNNNLDGNEYEIDIKDDPIGQSLILIQNKKDNIKEVMGKVEYQIYCDMDGVLADFERGYKELTGIDLKGEFKPDGEEFWDPIKQAGVKFWVGLKWMSGGQQLWNYIKPYAPKLLSAPSREESSRIGKYVWVKRKLPGTKLLLRSAFRKKEFANPNSILIDDRIKNIESWEQAGGIGIHHTNTENTIKELKKLGL